MIQLVDALGFRVFSVPAGGGVVTAGGVQIVPGLMSVGTITASAENDGPQAFRVADALGFYCDYFAYVTGQGLKTPSGLALQSGLINAGTFAINSETDASSVLRLADALGFYVEFQQAGAAQANDALSYGPRNASNLSLGEGPARQVAYPVCPVGLGPITSLWMASRFRSPKKVGPRCRRRRSTATR